MADKYTEMKPVAEIEGYDVFYMQEQVVAVKKEPVEVAVKTEPTDSDYDIQIVKTEPADNGYENPVPTRTQKRNSPKRGVENVLGLRPNRTEQVAVESRVDRLLEANDMVLASTDHTALKLRGRNPPSFFKKNILVPDGPTDVCDTEDTPIDSRGLVISNVLPTKDKMRLNPSIVCAVTANVALMGQNGKSLNTEVALYWCNYCSFKTEERQVLMKHVLTHRFRCHKPGCTFQAYSRSAVMQHEIDEHGGMKVSSLQFCALISDAKTMLAEKRKRQDNQSELEPASKRERLEETSTVHEPVIIIKQEHASQADTAVECELQISDVVSGSAAVNELVSSTPGTSPTPAAVVETEPPVESLQKPPSTKDGTVKLPVRTSPRTPSSSATNVIKTVTPVNRSSPRTSSTSTSNGKTVLTSSVKPFQKTSLSKAPHTVKSVSPVTKVQTPSPSAGTTSSDAGSNTTVNSGLCWSCGYCDFVTMSQSFLKVHLNTIHAKQTHKYVALLVTGKEEVDKIKAADAKMNTTVSQAVGLSKQGLTHMSAGNETVVSPPDVPVIEIDNAEEEVSMTEKEKATPPSYKCAHCNFSSLNTQLVKGHMIKTHIGHVIYGLDMKAARLKQKRYVLYCLKQKCDYYTKENSEYVEHLKSCTSKETNPSPLFTKSLESTKSFVEKLPASSILPKQPSVTYKCKYCLYQANKYLMKHHVLKKHADQQCIMKLRSNSSEPDSLVYFCRQCQWETNSESDYTTHVNDKKCMLTAMNNRPGPKSQPVKSTAVNTDSTDDDSRSSSSSMEVEMNNSSQTGTVECFQTEAYYRDFVPKQELDLAIARLEQSKRPRTSRAAALKCKRLIEESNNEEGKKIHVLPTLYTCSFCPTLEFGTQLIREHLDEKHSDLPLEASKVISSTEKKLVILCPVSSCSYYSDEAKLTLRHLMSVHKVKSNSEYAKRILQLQNSKKTEESTPAENVNHYQCIYCTQTMVYTDEKSMKTHITAIHHKPDVNDMMKCIFLGQYKQTNTKCLYLSCGVTCHTKDEYRLHLLGHHKAKIYECSECKWYTAYRDEINKHGNSKHPGKHVTVLEIDLDLDKNGCVTRYVGGTIIKRETR